MQVSSAQKSVAGVSLGGGRRENFFFCLLEHYPDQKGRWFLKSLHQVKDEEIQDRDEVLNAWIAQYGLSSMVVDFPLSRPLCETCQLECPGLSVCPQPSVVAVKEEMERLLLEDKAMHEENPKRYEQERNLEDEIDYSKNILHKRPEEHLLSRSFKRKLRKGFVPYWHRPIDFWIWKNYHDQLLDVFKMSYDSYGHVSVMLLARLNYLKRHFPPTLTLYESSIQIILLELYRAKFIGKFQMNQLFDLDLAAMARESLLRGIESALGIFIYDHDFDQLVKNPKAFDSFLLALAGKRLLQKSCLPIPDWGNRDGGRFIVPGFYS
jgi:hypothetical protein